MENVFKLHPKAKVVKMDDGLLLLKRALDFYTQKKLCSFAVEEGSKGDHTYWKIENGERLINSSKERGRIYDKMENFPEKDYLERMHSELIKFARNTDITISECIPTHLLLFMYIGKTGIGWHTDSGKNDGDGLKPIVSISIGNSCDFGVEISGKKQIV